MGTSRRVGSRRHYVVVLALPLICTLGIAFVLSAAPGASRAPSGALVGSGVEAGEESPERVATLATVGKHDSGRSLPAASDSARCVGPPSKKDAGQVDEVLRRARKRHAAAQRPKRVFVDAVDDSLEWLASHQSRSWGWDEGGLSAACLKARNLEPEDLPELAEARGVSAAGRTGAVLFAFLAAGYTNRGKHRYATVVSRGLRVLKNCQDAEGCFEKDVEEGRLFDHAWAALAMLEAYGMTGSPIFKGSAQRGLNFLLAARNPGEAWGHRARAGDNDLAVSTVAVLALTSARLINEDAVKRGKTAPLKVWDGAVHSDVRTWSRDLLTATAGVVAAPYQRWVPAHSYTAARSRVGMDDPTWGVAEAVCCGLMLCHLGETESTCPALRDVTKRCAALPCVWREDAAGSFVDATHWFFATLYMKQTGRELWNPWRKAVWKALLAAQCRETDACTDKGSWEPLGIWAAAGRVYTSALLCQVEEASRTHPCRVWSTRTR